MRYYRIQPWPAMDFTTREGVYLPDRTDGCCALDDAAIPPSGAVEVTASAYDALKASLLSTIASLPLPTDTDLDAITAILDKADVDVTTAELKAVALRALRRLRRRGFI